MTVQEEARQALAELEALHTSLMEEAARDELFISTQMNPRTLSYCSALNELSEKLERAREVRQQADDLRAAMQPARHPYAW